MITVLLAMWFIEVLPPEAQKPTSELSRILISNRQPKKQNSRQEKIIYSTVDLKVETWLWPFRVGESQYDLYMRMDTNTNGHRQWFYFSVKNLLPGTVRFNILRFKKRFSLFQRGMKPYIRSLKGGQEWKAGGTKMSYRCEKQPNQYGVSKQKFTYYLTFQYKFVHPEDQVFFSSGIPYTVTYLKSRLSELCSQKLTRGISFKMATVTKTMCGLEMPALTIQNENGSLSKNYIVINARTHPGQSSCSWVLDGLLEKITQDPQVQEWISTNNICIKVLPMLNMDGVFMGNYRTGIMGEDFNRKFVSGKKQIFPQIFALKKIVAECKKNGKLFLFLDLHGHSILKNSFIYGPVESLFTKNPLRSLPFSLWHTSKFFRLSSCKFKFNKDLTQTARVYFQIKDMILTYTCEISLGLYFQNNRTFQFSQADYKALGAAMAESFCELMVREKIQNYVDDEPSKIVYTCSSHTTKDLESREYQTSSNMTSKNKQAYFPAFKKEKSISPEKPKKQIERSEKIKCQTKKSKQSRLEKLQNRKSELRLQQKNAFPINEKINRNFDTRQKKQSLPSNPNATAFGFNKTLKTIKGDTLQQNKDLKNPTADSRDLKSKLPRASEKKYKEYSQSVKQDSVRDLTERESPLLSKQSSTKKANKQIQFKIRRKSDILKVLPERLRKKIGSKVSIGMNETSKYFNKEQEEQDNYVLERSVTYDPAYNNDQNNHLSTEAMELNDLEIINEKFSEEYSSINDQDSQSEDLCQKQKQYLLECIRNNRKLHTYHDSNDEENASGSDHEDGINGPANINGFRQIRFKSIDHRIKIQNSGHQNARMTKRQPHKFRDFTHKSLNRNYFEDQSSSPMMPTNMVQRKHLNERIQRKTQREPYFLIQIRNKNV